MVCTDIDMGKYKEVTLQIRDVLKEELFDSKQSFDEEKQKEVAEILKKNFNIKDEEMGKVLTKDLWMFEPESGYEFNTPLFAVPMFLPFGAMIIQSETFPNFNVKNKYIGYTDKGKFHRMDNIRKFIRHTKKDPVASIIMFIAVYLLVTTILSLVIK